MKVDQVNNKPATFLFRHMCPGKCYVRSGELYFRTENALVRLTDGKSYAPTYFSEGSGLGHEFIEAEAEVRWSYPR